jgi:sugar phosphate isomerase/epimerase
MQDFTASFQLYSSRQSASVEEQLNSLAALGFAAVEPYGDAYGDDPDGFRRCLDKAGLSAPSGHFAVDRLRDDMAGVIADATTLGVTTVVAPNLRHHPTDIAGWQAFARILEDYAAQLDRRGLALAWHNHAFEFEPLADGSRPIDHLLASPAIRWQADLGMVARAGAEPVDELRRYASKLHSIHAKDSAAPGVTAQGGWTDIGAGTLDWPAIWGGFAKSGARLVVLEHDDPKDWRAFAGNSLAYLSRLSGEAPRFIAMHDSLAGAADA